MHSTHTKQNNVCTVATEHRRNFLLLCFLKDRRKIDFQKFKLNFDFLLILSVQIYFFFFFALWLVGWLSSLCYCQFAKRKHGFTLSHNHLNWLFSLPFVVLNFKLLYVRSHLFNICWQFIMN